MPVTLYDAAQASNDDADAVSLVQLPQQVVEPRSDWEVWRVIEAGGGYGFNSFVLVTPDIEDDVRAGRDRTIAADYNLLGLQPDGSLYFQGARNVMWGDFHRAVDVGLFAGDADKIVFYNYGTAGGSFADPVPDILQWIADGTATLLGAVALAEAHARFGEKRRQRLADRWLRNGILPDRLRSYVRERQQHDPAVFASYFGLSENEARVVLSQLGLRQAPSGLWAVPTEDQ